MTKAIKKISVTLLEQLGNADARANSLIVRTLARRLTAQTASRLMNWAEN